MAFELNIHIIHETVWYRYKHPLTYMYYPDLLTCHGFNIGDFVPHTDDCYRSVRCIYDNQPPTDSGGHNCTGGNVFDPASTSCQKNPECNQWLEKKTNILFFVN